MIQINLLDQSSPRKSGAAAGAFAAATPRTSGNAAGNTAIYFTVMVMLALNGTLFWLAYKKVRASNVSVETAQAEKRELRHEISKKVTEADQIRKFQEVVNNQMDVLKSLDPTDRILWCEKINEVSNLMPRNVFLSEFKINEDVKMVETEQSKAAREKWAKNPNKEKIKEPPVIQKPVISYIVRLTGLALGKDNVVQMQNVTEFHRALIEHKETDNRGGTRRFMDGFNNNIEFESVEATTYEGTPVNKFIFRLTTKPLGEDQPADKAAGQAGKLAAQIKPLDLTRSEAKALASNN